MNKPEGRVKGLGEVSIRVRDLDRMCKFYEEVLGLQVLAREESYVFLRIADGYGGHSQNLALFDAHNLGFLQGKTSEISPERSTLHHIALNVALDDWEPERRRLEALGLSVEATQHEWLHIRSLYFSDPEGNLLELVARDESVG